MHPQTEGALKERLLVATDPPFNKSEAMLREHLLTMIHDDILVLENGKYRLKGRKR